jgi:hypothetical protein
VPVTHGEWKREQSNLSRKNAVDVALPPRRQEFQKYFDYVADARLDRSEPIESDEQAQKSPMIFRQPWTIPFTIIRISWTS